MKFVETPLPGVFVLDAERQVDERGFFARVWCVDELGEHGIDARIVQCSISYNERRGTLRGMHMQREPATEAKVVRCTAGAVYDVVVDLRPASPSFMRWFAAELTADNRRSLYIPKGCAHGFQTLAPATEVSYLISEFHRPELAMGVRWDDPAFGIEWPEDERTISTRDRAYPDFDRESLR